MHIPRLCQSFRVFDRDIELKIILIHALESLGNVQLIAMRPSRAIEPAFVIEADGVHNQSVAFPMADGITHVTGRDVVGMFAPVSENMAHGMVIFVEQDDFFRSLHDLYGKGLQINSRNARRITFGDNRIVCLG